MEEEKSQVAGEGPPVLSASESLPSATVEPHIDNSAASAKQVVGLSVLQLHAAMMHIDIGACSAQEPPKKPIAWSALLKPVTKGGDAPGAKQGNEQQNSQVNAAVVSTSDKSKPSSESAPPSAEAKSDSKPAKEKATAPAESRPADKQAGDAERAAGTDNADISEGAPQEVGLAFGDAQLHIA